MLLTVYFIICIGYIASNDRLIIKEGLKVKWKRPWSLLRYNRIRIDGQSKIIKNLNPDNWSLDRRSYPGYESVLTTRVCSDWNTKAPERHQRVQCVQAVVSRQAFRKRIIFSIFMVYPVLIDYMYIEILQLLQRLTSLQNHYQNIYMFVVSFIKSSSHKS
jgi:hypothetical protein